jgi:catechol-2,3-dioxygenase
MTNRKFGTIAAAPTIKVSDLDLAEGFYQEVLGLRVIDESLDSPIRYATMARDGIVVLTLCERDERKSEHDVPHLTRIQFATASPNQVEQAKGILDYHQVPWSEGRRRLGNRYASEAIQFADPDGVRIELYSDDYAGSAAARAYLPSETGIQTRCAADDTM